MASLFNFCSDHGAAIAGYYGANHGTTRSTGISDLNWKNADDSSTAYTAAPITAGNNSYEKFMFGVWTGTFNQISNVKWQHTGGGFGAGLTLKLNISGSGMYTTPAVATNARLTGDFNGTGTITTGWPVKVGALHAEASGKANATSANPAFTEYIVTQLQTTVAASAGDTAQIFMLLNFDEN